MISNDLSCAVPLITESPAERLNCNTAGMTVGKTDARMVDAMTLAKASRMILMMILMMMMMMMMTTMTITMTTAMVANVDEG